MLIQYHHLSNRIRQKTYKLYCNNWFGQDGGNCFRMKKLGFFWWGMEHVFYCFVKGVTARSFVKPFGYWAVRGLLWQLKNCHNQDRAELTLFRLIAVWVSVYEVMILSTKDFNKRQEESQQKIEDTYRRWPHIAIWNRPCYNQYNNVDVTKQSAIFEDCKEQRLYL